MPGTHIRFSDQRVSCKSSRNVHVMTGSATFFADVIYHMWVNNPYGASPAFHSFCNRLFQITQPSTSTIILALNYIYRYKETTPLCLGAFGTEYYIAVVALILANKYHEDKCYSNRSWAKVSGLDIVQLSRMELIVLTTFSWNIKVDKLEYDSWSQFLAQYWAAITEFRCQHTSEQGLNIGVKDYRCREFMSINPSIASVS